MLNRHLLLSDLKTGRCKEIVVTVSSVFGKHKDRELLVLFDEQILGGNSGVLECVLSMAKVVLVLLSFLVALSILLLACILWLLKQMVSITDRVIVEVMSTNGL